MSELNSIIKESAEKYQFIINNILDVIVEIDLDGPFSYVSSHFKDMFGYNTEEVIGKSVFNYIHPDDISHFIETFEKAIQEEIIVNTEFRVRNRKGYYIAVNAKGRLVRIDNKTKIVIVLRDISDRKLIEQKLKESEENFREITEQSFMGISIIQGSSIKYVNKTITQILGFSNEEIEGWSLKELFNVIHPDDRQLAFNCLDRRQKGIIDETPDEVYRIFTKSGEMKWMDTYSKIIKYHGKDAILATLIDVTDREKGKQKHKASKEKYRELFSNMSSGVAVYEAINNGKDFIFKDFNLAGEKIDDVRREDVINKKITEVFPGVKKFGLLDVFQKVWKTGKPKNHPISLYRDNRIEGWRENYVYKLPSGEIVAVYNDVTERKKAEQKLKESEEKYRMIFNGANEPIGIMDEENIVDCNDIFVKLFKYNNKDEIIGIPPWKISPIQQPDGQDSVKKANEFIKKALLGEPQRFYWTHMKKDGTPFDTEISLSSFKTENKKYIMAIIRDITDLKKAEKELREISQLRKELLERTSHELKTPLISIKGFTELILELHKEKLNSEVFSIVEEIRQGTEQLETIINKLLESSFLDSGKYQFQPSKEDLSFLIRFCIKDLRGLAETRNHYIKLDIPEKLVLNFEKERLYEVITHLIINAIKYTPPYGEIRVQARKTKDYVIVSVQDNGIGLSEEEQKKIFKQFGKIERYGQGWDISTEGTGMGLYTSKKIIELHGGEIWVESEGRNKGSKFCFSLPLSKK